MSAARSLEDVALDPAAAEGIRRALLARGDKYVPGHEVEQEPVKKQALARHGTDDEWREEIARMATVEREHFAKLEAPHALKGQSPEQARKRIQQQHHLYEKRRGRDW